MDGSCRRRGLAGIPLVRVVITLAATGTLQGSATTATTVTATVHGMELVGATETYKVLAQIQLAAAAGVVYTVPGSTTAFIKIIFLLNQGTTNQTVVLYVNGTAATNAIMRVQLPPLGSAVYDGRWNVYDVNGNLFQTLSSGLAATRPLSTPPATFGAVETILYQIPIPANTLQVGTTIGIIAHGIITATSPTLLPRLRIGTLGTIGDTQCAALAAGAAIATGTGWQIDAYWTCRTIGAGGTCIGNYNLAATAPAKTAQTATVAINTTVANFLSLTAIGGGTTPVVTLAQAYPSWFQQ
jgi:hypothetical protein